MLFIQQQGNPECKECNRWEQAQVICVNGRGPVPCKIALVGEAPAHRKADRVTIPFSGASGSLLRKLMLEVGLDIEQCYVTNVLHCYSPEDPTQKEIKTCVKYLWKELEEVKPSYVLLLGATALKGVLKKTNLTIMHGAVLEEGGISYMPTFHPAAALRDPSKINLIKADLIKFKSLTEGEIKTTPEDFNYTVIDSKETFNECVEDIRANTEISFDLETSGFDMYASDSEVHCMSIYTGKDGTPQRGWVLPLQFRASPFANDTELQQMMIDILTDESIDKKVITQNGKFDNKWLRSKYNHKKFNITFDVMLASHLVDENTPHGLKYLARLFFNAEYDISDDEKRGEVSDPKRLYKYNALDSYYTLKLYYKYRAELLKDQDLARVFKFLTMPASNMFEDIEEHGVYLNLEKLVDLEVELKAREARLYEELKQFVPNRPDMNWNSPKQVGAVMYGPVEEGGWGLKVIEITKSGAPSTAEPIIKQLKDQHKGVEKLLEYREVSKQLSAFVEGWKEYIKLDRRMHPNFKLHGTVTGRLSCSNPNLQQVPRDPKIRSIVTAPPGWTLIEADLSQAELRIAAMEACEPTMIQIFNNATMDIHKHTAAIMLGKNEEKVTKDERKKAKAVNFGLLYGMGSKGLKDYAKQKYDTEFTLEEAVDFRNKFFESYPALLKWHSSQRTLVRAYHQVRSLIGRIRHLPGILSQDEDAQAAAERESINSPVQSFASDLNVCALIQMCQEFDKEWFQPIGTIHDAVLAEVRNDKVEFVAKRVGEIMSHPRIVEEDFGITFTVPIEAEVKVCPEGWGT